MAASSQALKGSTPDTSVVGDKSRQHSFGYFLRTITLLAVRPTMRYAVLTLAIVFATLSMIAFVGLGWRLVGWSIAGAFQSVLHATDDPAAHTELSIWAAASIISGFFTVRLIMLYRRQWK